ncbi:MAG: hypothetical protein CL489_11620 [Acidobacteria bacterium]|nr:hypothetical protein [Acidobacteriota bacterium]
MLVIIQRSLHSCTMIVIRKYTTHHLTFIFNTRQEILGSSMTKEKESDEWHNMPEFVQDKKEPFSKIIIRFETLEDLTEFAKIIGQKLTPKTKSIWYPYKPHRSGAYKRRWIDTEDKKLGISELADN